MQDEELSAIGCFVHHFPRDRNIAKIMIDVSSGKGIMITWNEKNLGSFAGFAENFLNDVIVFLGPVPIALQCPAINNVADKV